VEVHARHPTAGRNWARPVGYRGEEDVIKEFREFISRGNVVDLAVAVIIGGAFGLVVASFTDDILMQIISAIVGEPDFSDLTFTLNDSVIRYGSFITAVVNFLIIAAALFLVVKAINAAQAYADRNKAEEEAEATEIELLTEIRDELRNGRSRQV
jgi:large conductance mechanosensitive channel